MIRLILIAILLAAPAHAEIVGMKVKRAVSEAQMKESLRQIELVDAAGTPLDLRGLMANGKPTLVTLWAHWCPNCVSEIAGYRAIARRCADRWNVVFVSARAGDYPRDLAKFSGYGLPWKIYRVADGAGADVAKAQVARAFYGATAAGGVVTPLHYLLAAGGRVDAIVSAKMDFEEPQRLAAFCS